MGGEGLRGDKPSSVCGRVRFSFFPRLFSGRKYASDGPLAPAQCEEGRSGPGSLSRITVISTGSALQSLRLPASLPPRLQRNAQPKSAPGRNLRGSAVGALGTVGGTVRRPRQVCEYETYLWRHEIIHRQSVTRVFFAWWYLDSFWVWVF